MKIAIKQVLPDPENTLSQSFMALTRSTIGECLDFCRVGSIVVTVFGALTLAPGDGFGQQGQQSESQGRESQVSKGSTAQPQQFQPAWTKLCNKATQPETTQDVNVCLTFKETLNNINGTLIGSVGIRELSRGSGPILVVSVPLGVDLRSGVQIRLDNGTPLKLTYALCNRVQCNADGQVSADWVTAMKAGQKLSVEVRGPRGNAIAGTVPLAGFAAALDGGGMDAKQYQEARQKIVDAIRARSSAQIKKALESIDSGSLQQPQNTQQ
jgi:invasion protein IalB